MDNFLTWDVLLTFSGCVAGTVLLTEWTKDLFKSIPTQIVSFVIALAILGIGHAATNTFVWAEAPLYLVNAVAVSLSANGGFDALKKMFGKTAVMDELVIDESAANDENSVYLSMVNDPKDFETDEIIKLKVKKISQE